MAGTGMSPPPNHFPLSGEASETVQGPSTEVSQVSSDTRNSHRQDWLPTTTFPEGLRPWPAREVSGGEAGASGMSLESCQQTQSCHHPNPTKGLDSSANVS